MFTLIHSFFSEKFELIKDSESRLSQTDLVARYKMLNGPVLDILKRKQKYFADPNLNQCSVEKRSKSCNE